MVNEVLKDIDTVRIAELFQSLNILIENEKDDDSNEVPGKVKDCVEKFQKAIDLFIDEIDEYMHRMDHDPSESETDEAIITKCPEFLASEDDDDSYLPIHCAAGEDSEKVFVPMYAEVAIKNCIFDEEARGGLTQLSRYGRSALKFIKEVDTLKILAESTPKLFAKEDIVDYNLLHAAVQYGSMDLAQFFISILPSALYSKDEDGDLPICCCTYGSGDKIRLCLDSAIKFDPSHSSIGGLFETCENSNRKTIEEIVARNNEEAYKTISKVLNYQQSQIPILQNLIKHTPHLLDRFIAYCPDASFVRDQDGRLPIHTALQVGIPQSLGLTSLINANREHLGDLDPVTKFCPSALAAMEPACDLDTIYQLIRMHPNHVESGIEIKKKRWNTRKNNNARGSTRKKRRKSR